MASNGNSDEEEGWKKIRKARQFQELFHGRFTQQNSIDLLKHNNWDSAVTLGFTLAATTDALREVLGVNWQAVEAATKDEVLRNIARDKRIPTDVRQFACESCDNVWWYRVPARKMVSRCKKCKERMDALPRDREWGWAIFECPCGNEFGGFGAMGKTESLCYRCGTHFCTPVRIESPEKRRENERANGHGGRRRSSHTHSCTARNCFNRSAPGAGGAIVNWCVHPKSLRRQVVEPSTPHESTGSTVDTFLNQNDLRRSSGSLYESSLQGIKEEDVDEEDSWST